MTLTKIKILGFKGKKQFILYFYKIKNLENYFFFNRSLKTIENAVI